MKLPGLIIILSFLFVSCGSNDKAQKSSPATKDTTDDFNVRVINKIDTTYYLPVKNRFYRTSHGDIYELKMDSGEDSAGWYDYYYLDSTLTVGEYSDRKPIKLFLDLATYTEVSLSDFSKDKNYVYYTRAQSDGHVRFVVEKANPKTFIGIKGQWGKDDKYVFYEDRIVAKADVKTFQIYQNSIDTLKDKNHFYKNGEIIK